MKNKYDSMYNTELARRDGPGPAEYNVKHPVSSIRQTIAIKLKDNRKSQTDAGNGPGKYDLTTTFMKKEPRVIIGLQKRILGMASQHKTPGP